MVNAVAAIDRVYVNQIGEGSAGGGNRDYDFGMVIDRRAPARIFAVHWHEPSVPRVITPPVFFRGPIPDVKARERRYQEERACSLSETCPHRCVLCEAPGEDRIRRCVLRRR